MAGHTSSYKFEAFNEKLDEVELVDDAVKSNGGQQQKKIVVKASIEKATVSIVILFAVIIGLVLQGMIIGLLAYNISLQHTDSEPSQCINGVAASSDPPSASTGAEGATYNATEIRKILQAFTNDVVQLVNSSHASCYSQNASNVHQTLQEIQTIDDDFHTNISDTLTLLLGDIEAYFTSIISTLSNHRDITITTATVVDDILIGVDKLLEIHNASALYNSITPVACKDIKAHFPDSPSGYYHVNNRNIYCNMGELCDSSEGWTRIAYLDMTDSTESCPDELQLYQDNGVRACGRQHSSTGGCSSVKFPTNGISYMQICGRVTGYQRGTTDGVTPANDDPYSIDGIKLTRGSSRQHVWALISGALEGGSRLNNCPCNNPPGLVFGDFESYVGDYYYCESGNPTSYWNIGKLYTSDPIWDGKMCGGQEGNCCSANGLPWFHRQYDNATTDYIEMRFCGDEGTNNEGTPVSFYEIFVK